MSTASCGPTHFACDCTLERMARLELEQANALAALRLLYSEQVDYITINHLGDPHRNVSMQLARDVLGKKKRGE